MVCFYLLCSFHLIHPCPKVFHSLKLVIPKDPTSKQSFVSCDPLPRFVVNQ